MPDYNYSDANNKNSGITWDEATLKVYLKDPKVPSATGHENDLPWPFIRCRHLDNVIAYLKTFPAPAKWDCRLAQILVLKATRTGRWSHLRAVPPVVREFP